MASVDFYLGSTASSSLGGCGGGSGPSCGGCSGRDKGLCGHYCERVSPLFRIQP
jgi:hypothetical protein